jgi:SAM-dependent methyltransferase
MDLACGDASAIATALRGTNIAHYRGVDLAPPAIAHAKRHLEMLPCEVELELADFVEAVRDNSKPVDIAWVSLSLHHFPTPEKLSIMRAVRDLLSEDGAFLIYEPTCLDGEDRRDWLDRFEEAARRDWADLTPEELAESLNHVRTCDLPESVSEWAALGRQAGFSGMEERYRDPWDLFRLLCYRP